MAPQRVDGVEAVTQVPKPPWRPVPRGTVTRAGSVSGQSTVKGAGSRSGWLSRWKATSMLPAQPKVMKVSSREERPPETKPLEPVCPGIQISPSGPGWPTDVALSSLVMAPVGGGEESGAPKGGWNGNHVQLKGSGDGTYLRVGVLKPGVWVVSDPGAVLDPSGREVRGAQGCADPKKDAFDCFATSNLHIEVDYQPADRYWIFQWIETGIFLALSALLAGFCSWWLRRRTA